MDHVGLPPAETSPIPATSSVGEQQVYLVKISLANLGFSCILAMTHESQFTDDELNQMLQEAANDVQKLRVAARRKSIASSGMKLSDSTDPVKIRADIVTKNEQWFASDVDFLEAVMCDKFNFRKLNVNKALLSLEPTAKIA